MASTRLQAIDKRYLEILEVGGPRKRTILRALAKTPDQFRRSMRRLHAARLMCTQKRYGGPHIALRKEHRVRH